MPSITMPAASLASPNAPDPASRSEAPPEPWEPWEEGIRKPHPDDYASSVAALLPSAQDGEDLPVWDGSEGSSTSSIGQWVDKAVELLRHNTYVAFLVIVMVLVTVLGVSGLLLRACGS